MRINVRPRRTRRQRQRGFTLIELMVSLTLFSFAIAGVLAIAVSMAQGYREQRQTVETETAARGALDFMADVTRMASPAVKTSVSGAAAEYDTTPAPGDPNIAIGPIEDRTGATGVSCPRGAVRMFNAFAADGSDALEVVYASGAVTSLRVAAYAGGTTMDVADASNFAPGDHLLVTDGTTGHLVRIASIASTTLTLDALTCTEVVAPNYPVNSFVMRANRARFYVASYTDGVLTIPALFMDPDADGAVAAEPLVDYVEDFQVAVGIEQDGNNIVDADEFAFSSVSAVTEPLVATDKLRAIRMSLVVRAPSALTATTATFTKPTLEDHTPAAGTDTFRRRTLSTTIDVRNFTESPK